MHPAFTFISHHKKRLISSTIIFVVSTFVAGILLTGISVFALSQKKFQTTSIASQSASLFLSPYLLIGEMANSCSWKTFHSTLSLLSHSPELNELVTQTIDEYQQTGVSEETADKWKPYVFTIDQTVQNVNQCQQKSPIFKGLVKAIFGDRINFEQLANLVSLFPTMLENYHQLGGFDQPQYILVLIQNNRELRATGGFLGSYAYLTIERGKFRSIELQDIYVPDGQLTGHVDPPPPIQQAFQQGFWKLRDANWHPDFPQSVTNIDWFFQQAGWENPDLVIAIDISAIEDILQNIEPLYLTEFASSFNSDEIYPLLQTEVEEDFFAGSTKKRDLLHHVFVQIVETLKTTSSKQKFDMVKNLAASLDQKHILLFSNNSNTQKVIERKNFAGKLENKNLDDYFAIFESNLGVNKSNCCVLREGEIHKKTTDGILQTTVKLRYQLDQIPANFSNLAGDYKSYIRLYLPPQTSLQYIKVNQREYRDFVSENIVRKNFTGQTPLEPSIGNIDNFSEIGFWLYVPQNALSEVEVVLTNQLTDFDYSHLLIQKQPGTMDFFNHFQIEIDEKELFKGILTEDVRLQIK